MRIGWLRFRNSELLIRMAKRADNAPSAVAFTVVRALSNDLSNDRSGGGQRNDFVARHDVLLDRSSDLVVHARRHSDDDAGEKHEDKHDQPHI